MEGYEDKPAVSGHMPEEFDRLLGSLDGLPDVTRTKASTVTVTPPMGVGGSRTFIVHTLRQRDVVGHNADGSERAVGRDTIFLQMIGQQGSFRIAIPPAVADAIARQRDALTVKTRSKIGAARAAADKAAGKVPGFARKKGGKR